jgi:phosphatidylglycerophosphatase A
MNKFFLTFFYTGLSPYAPGTVGSIAALGVGLYLLNFIDTAIFFWLTVVISYAGVKLTDIYIEGDPTRDPKEVVIDEVAGMWLALSMINLEPLNIALAFIFFRAYDIMKPSIIGRIDRAHKGGLSVMGDDILAGFFAAVSAEIVVKMINYVEELML